MAAATGAAFVREIFTGTYASDMGVWAPDAGAARRYQARLGISGVATLYNVSAEFAGSLDPRPLADRARSAVFSSIPDAVLVSGALLPTLTAAMVKSDHEVQKVIVSQPQAPLHPSEVEFEAFLKAHAPLDKPAATGADDPAFWLYSSGSTGRPKGTVHSHANPYWTCELYGKGVLGLKESDVCFSAAKLFFAYGLGNALSLPLSVGATTLLMAERATPDATFRRWRGEVGGVRPTVFFGAPTGYAGMLASPALPRREELALRLASSAGEALPADIGERFTRHFGVEIIDGIGSTEMLHIFISATEEQARGGATGQHHGVEVGPKLFTGEVTAHVDTHADEDVHNGIQKCDQSADPHPEKEPGHQVDRYDGQGSQ